MNVKYASDPYWGEKIAAIYRSVDAFVDYKDYNKYTIGVKTSNVAVPVYSETKTDSVELYKLTSKAHEVTNMPVYVLGKVKGENIRRSSEIKEQKKRIKIVTNKSAYGIKQHTNNIHK